MKDLFGNEIDERVIPLAPETEKGKRRLTKPNGYARRPGTGPQNETCGTCANACRCEIRSGRAFYKCAIIRHRWTCGPGTDIRLRSPACELWKAK